MIVCTLKQNENVGIKLQGFKKISTCICPFLIHRKPPANSSPYFLLLNHSIFGLVPFASLFCVFSSSFNKKMQMKKGLSLAQFSLVLAISLGHCTRAC